MGVEKCLVKVKLIKPANLGPFMLECGADSDSLITRCRLTKTKELYLGSWKDHSYLSSPEAVWMHVLPASEFLL